MKTVQFLAFDLGAESGRAILGTFVNHKITVMEIHRFPTGMMPVHGHLQWNIFRFYEEMILAMKKCHQDFKVKPESLGIDTWGVDFALLNSDGTILGLPYCYRDPRTDGIMDEFFRIMPREKLYELTGIQFMQFNSVFQLFSVAKSRSLVLEEASDLLFIPDIFNYQLSGVKKSEFSFATTSQLYNPMSGTWESEIFKAIVVKKEIMQQIVQPGTILANLTDRLAQQTGIGPVPIVAVASHDTGSAIAAIPSEGENWAYISSGTWSLMGVESKKPLISSRTLAYNITNEGGVGNTYRVLKNIMGLWLLQQCRVAWISENYSYAQLVTMASGAIPFKAFIDPDCNDFMNPPDMPMSIKEYCKKTGQAIPDGHAEICRTIMEGLAFKYRYTLDQLKEIYPHPIEKVYIIGGGVQNELLCQFTANACGLPVITGPAEGTALGNLLVQAMAMGHLGSLSEIRQVVRNSFSSKQYNPVQTSLWEQGYKQFNEILNHIKNK